MHRRILITLELTERMRQSRFMEVIGMLPKTDEERIATYMEGIMTGGKKALYNLSREEFTPPGYVHRLTGISTASGLNATSGQFGIIFNASKDISIVTHIDSEPVLDLSSHFSIFRPCVGTIVLGCVTLMHETDRQIVVRVQDYRSEKTRWVSPGYVPCKDAGEVDTYDTHMAVFNYIAKAFLAQIIVRGGASGEVDIALRNDEIDDSILRCKMYNRMGLGVEYMRLAREAIRQKSMEDICSYSEKNTSPQSWRGKRR